jgi:hypothetical protein
LPFNYLMQVQAGGYFIEFSRCESFKLNIWDDLFVIIVERKMNFLSTSTWKSEKKIDFVLKFPVFVYADYIVWVQCHASRAEPCFLLMSSLCNCKWLLLQVTSDHKYHVCIKSPCRCYFLSLLWIEWANSFVLFSGCDSLWVQIPHSYSVILLVLFHELLWIKWPIFCFTLWLWFVFHDHKQTKEKESILCSWKVDVVTKLDGDDNNASHFIGWQISYWTVNIVQHC